MTRWSRQRSSRDQERAPEREEPTVRKCLMGKAYDCNLHCLLLLKPRGQDLLSICCLASDLPFSVHVYSCC
jgi:hypothetical protein